MTLSQGSAPFNVLFIDSYDSFSYNVVRLVEQQSHKGGYGEVRVTTIHNDTFAHVSELKKFLPHFDCLVLGPGPGSPVNGVEDVGLLASLFQDDCLSQIPILGICLGFQAMCLSQGAQVNELRTIKHGQVYDMELANESKLFKGYPFRFKSTRYHSLHVEPSLGLIPLVHTTDENGELLMAAQVVDKPWFGVQYHPESCCSELGGLLISNFLHLAQEHNEHSGRFDYKKSIYDVNIYDELDKTIDKTPIYENRVDLPTKHISITEYNVCKSPLLTLCICDSVEDRKFVMASSSQDLHRGRWSIICFPNENSDVLTHYATLNRTTAYKWRDQNVSWKDVNYALENNSRHPCVFSQDKDQFWQTLGQFTSSRLINARPDLPFIGGLVGTLGYEMGDVVPSVQSHHPDAKLVYIENSIVIDHFSGKMYTISLSKEFPAHITQIIDQLPLSDPQLQWPSELPPMKFDIDVSSDESYQSAFDACQDYMHRGDSYEICLTRQTQVTPHGPLTPWRIFQTLVSRNPAPFASFFEFQDLVDLPQDRTLCLLSTSPERFLKWDHDTCELRPIKGTVKKSDEMNLQMATEILKTPKEFGENLMILDLIRNDLYELLPDVHVEEFMSVEEYQTVYQMVSVVQAHNLSKSIYSGLDVLKHSLPPGSMTGAPKKITVQLLHELEERKRRGVYSGVTGYLSMNNRADWSVNIRCLYSYNGGLRWMCGAGGAITVLSQGESELAELNTKLDSALQCFTRSE
ncbi:ZYRO0D08118p [Zygosaccharomyces rouxii]|uniref:aminodeoxychorismate synthase n=2 Tax=Zygosaccharomyces rouxii TaxID=4956 RepID=C5DVN4_ZYGRC|nr:uncharacterized protein ZYRO0D08118g [Zygosaccharomyces rouxii]KAH9200765.1 Aminodeoxychorismate synthase [Zygosaccharomyces rouxii]CAQ43604.1 Aminodeoxychorismate synthase [Zygosaccharomyces rouxii]CAR27853.1 ZYRO0D08118p [Zygosaccharomyces rouxii]